MTSTKNARFVATVTPSTIVQNVDKNGRPFFTLKGATIKTRKSENQRTVVIFGDELPKLRRSISVGQPVDLVVEPNGGSLKAIHFARKAALPAAA